MPPETTRPLRVAIVAPSLRILGGQAVQAERLLRGWADDPAVSAWLVPNNPIPPGPLRAGVNLKFVRTVVTQLTFWPLLVREISRADIVHVFSASYSSFVLSTLPAMLIGRLLRRPVLVHYHSGQAPGHLQSSRLARYTLRHLADAIAVPSAFLRDVFARFDLAAQIVPNNVDLEKFSYRPRGIVRPRLLSTRNLEEHYNVACTLRAFAIVQRKYPGASLTIVGGGSHDAMLKHLARELGLRNVTFVGRVPADDIARFYADADIYVQTPVVDNMPLSVLEAYASGLPVVSTAVGGVPSILTDRVHGLLAPDDDHEGVAACVIELLEDPAFANRLAAAAHATCRRYTWAAVRPQWVELYRDVTEPATMPAATTA